MKPLRILEFRLVSSFNIPSVCPLMPLPAVGHPVRNLKLFEGILRYLLAHLSRIIECVCRLQILRRSGITITESSRGGDHLYGAHLYDSRWIDSLSPLPVTGEGVPSLIYLLFKVLIDKGTGISNTGVQASRRMSGQGPHVGVLTEAKPPEGADTGQFALRRSTTMPRHAEVVNVKHCPMGGGWTVPPNFDFSKPTNENYAAAPEDRGRCFGEYKDVRATRDFDYHGTYCKERQLFQGAD